MTQLCEFGHKTLKSGYCPTCKPNYKPRGPDKKPRAPLDKKSFARKYYDYTGRSLSKDMKAQIDEIEEMKRLAEMENDPTKKFEMMVIVNKARKDYNALYLPYLESKLGVIKTDTMVEDQISIDDVLDGNDGTKY